MTRLPALLLAVAVLPAIHAQEPAHSVSKPSAFGRVLDSVTGKPIPDAIITLWAPANQRGYPDIASVVTASDSQGRFSLWAVKPGSYRLTVERRGFASGRASTMEMKFPTESLETIVMKLTPQAIV